MITKEYQEVKAEQMEEAEDAVEEEEFFDADGEIEGAR